MKLKKATRVVAFVVSIIVYVNRHFLNKDYSETKSEYNHLLLFPRY